MSRSQAVGGVACLVAGALAGWVAIRGNHIDFEVYVRAGARLLDGRDPYAARAELPFTYPPFAAILGALMSLAQPIALAMLALLTVVSTSFATVASWGTASGPVALLLVAGGIASEPVLRSLHLGQVNGLVVGLVVVDLLIVPTRWRGWLTGLAAGIKLTPLVFVLHPIFRRDWAMLVRMLAGLAATVVAGAAVLPAASRRFWGDLVADPGRVGGLGFADNQSLRGVAERLVPNHAAVVWALASLVVLALGMRALALRRDRPAIESVLTCGLIGLLVSPISWSHHWLMLPAVAALLLRERRFVSAVVVATVALLAPHWYLGGVLPGALGAGALGAAAANSMALAGILALVTLGLRPSRTSHLASSYAAEASPSLAVPPGTGNATA
ncbi:MAG: glycosyltransferase 87 family protein [Micrococcales bacterium]|nr:glycosyltransferase 87 family protein [Micrococcales bacterium]